MATSSDNVHQSSDLVKSFVCGACETKNIQESADYLCGTCMKFFCGTCIYQHDQLYANHSKYGRGATQKWLLAKKMVDLLLKCDDHIDKKLETFCQDHNKLCCSECVQLNHSQCTNVVLISDSVKKMSLDLQQLSINLQTILDRLNTFKSTTEANIQSVEVSLSEKLQEIRNMRNIINATLDDLQNTTLKELNKIRTTLQTSLKKDVDNCMRLKDELQQLGEAVQNKLGKTIGRKRGKQSQTEIKFIASRKCLDKIQESETCLKENPLKDLSLMKFEANIDIEEYLSKKSGLGKIGVINQVLTVKRKVKYNVKLPNDTAMNCFITGICSLPCGHTIAVDRNNYRVKLFDQQYNLVSHCDVSGCLFDICQITSSEVAVTASRFVQFISVRNGQLINGRRMELPSFAVGITHHLGELYVTDGINALFKYTMTGTLVKTLHDEYLGASKCAVSPAGDRIYVTSYILQSPITLAADGTLISTFTIPELQYLQYPYGISVTAAGQVLFCRHGSNTVIQVDREGKQKLATLVSDSDGVSRPYCVCVNKNIDQIIVGLQDSNTIIVLELQ